MTGLLLLLLVQPPSPADPQQRASFQQEVHYRIEAVLDEPAEVLHGRARLRYTNRSPARLDTLYLHQYLNAFRPNSDWARRELEFGERRFQDLSPVDQAYERFTRITVGGVAVNPVYPGAPDSTVVAIPLPQPLASGGTVTVLMDWDARPSTIPRRQGRRDRHYDFAQWYPRIAAYDERGWEPHALLPQGEFYGEFATYDVTLDVAADQVIGATGVPVDGDPGWQGALGSEPGGEVRYRRDAYRPGTADPLGLLPTPIATGRKRVRWYAEKVHHFAWSVDPTFRYEGGRLRDIAINVLYQPGDLDWDLGTVVRRTIRALSWLEGVFGPYPYPTLTVLHRIEGGGTEFPMLVMNGGESQGLIVHETAHQYAHGILANNEWREAWLDEGMASLLSNWFAEEHGVVGVWTSQIARAAEWTPEVYAQPVATPAADFTTFQAYATMSYGKGSIVLRMLQEYLGTDGFRRGLRLYYERHRFTHVTEADLRRAMEDASGRDLGWFFQEWLHTAAILDYGLGDVTTAQSPDGRWQTRVEVTRKGDAWMPVTLQVGAERRSLATREQRQVIEVTTERRPQEVILDPDYLILDADRSNNRTSVP